jgi:hypothetical protein
LFCSQDEEVVHGIARETPVSIWVEMEDHLMDQAGVAILRILTVGDPMTGEGMEVATVVVIDDHGRVPNRALNSGR